tara:strand:+ start:2125 stop:2370 length:246 start_codon:yes stop_codon:yes gene_type:complete
MSNIIEDFFEGSNPQKFDPEIELSKKLHEGLIFGGWHSREIPRLIDEAFSDGNGSITLTISKDFVDENEWHHLNVEINKLK